MCNSKLNILLLSLEISSDVIEFVVSFGHSFHDCNQATFMNNIKLNLAL